MMPAIRRAISTPRDGIPARTTEASSGFRSMISCAIRRRARLMASPSITGRVVADGAEVWAFGLVVTCSLATSLDRIKGMEKSRGLSRFGLCPL